MINYFHRKQIDEKRWDQLISDSGYETAYAYTWYLDICTENWGAFIMDDYSFVMPLAFKKKFGLKYVYQPLFCQQLGVFSIKEIEPDITKEFLKALLRHFKIGDYAFNAKNLLGESEECELTDNTNYVLDLSQQFDTIQKNYTENCRRNIKKAHQSDLEFTDKITVEDVVTLKKSSEKLKRPDAHYEYLRQLFNDLQAEGRIKIFGVKKEKHIFAASIFAFSSSRILYLLSFSSEMGKKQRGMFLIVDAFIRMHAGEPLVLDFEGSNISNIARFYRGFGAKPEIYQRISFANAQGVLLKRIRNVRFH